METAASISNQTSNEFEWIVIDGGSTDGTVEFLQGLESIDHFISEQDDGIYDAMNKGIQLARGRYCLFLNAGDSLFDSQVMDRVQGYLLADLVVGSIKKSFPNHPHKTTITRFDDQDIREKYLYLRSLPHQSTFIRRELFSNHGEYEKKFKILGDHDFFARVILQGATISFLPFCVADYQMDGISTTLKKSQLFQDEMSQVRRRNFSFFYRLKRRILDYRF